MCFYSRIKSNSSKSSFFRCFDKKLPPNVVSFRKGFSTPEMFRLSLITSSSSLLNLNSFFMCAGILVGEYERLGNFPSCMLILLHSPMLLSARIVILT